MGSLTPGGVRPAALLTALPLPDRGRGNGCTRASRARSVRGPARPSRTCRWAWLSGRGVASRTPPRERGRRGPAHTARARGRVSRVSGNGDGVSAFPPSRRLALVSVARSRATRPARRVAGRLRALGVLGLRGPEPPVPPRAERRTFSPTRVLTVESAALLPSDREKGGNPVSRGSGLLRAGGAGDAGGTGAAVSAAAASLRAHRLPRLSARVCGLPGRWETAANKPSPRTSALTHLRRWAEGEGAGSAATGRATSLGEGGGRGPARSGWPARQSGPAARGAGRDARGSCAGRGRHRQSASGTPHFSFKK